ncbi:MAG: DNA polymerase III subunit delta' [Deltaproteobacteria bacterium]|nr:DNA polymerase III subunit delta' [Deltaproteobacteria bacterium]
MSFKDIYGHEKQIAVLQASMAKGRIAQAYLFYGMKGVGKRTTAAAFAKALNCGRASEILDACDTCPSCLKADHGNHPNIVNVEAKGPFIQRQAILELQDHMKFRPAEGGRRVIIMADADRMNAVAANTLLKTLEEPSPAHVLILITARPHFLPLTILSRCQQVRFNPLPASTVARFLSERRSIEEDAARLLAASAGGSIAAAMETNRESFLNFRQTAMNTIAAMNRTDPLETLAFVAELGQDRKEITDRLAILMNCYRDALIYKETGEVGALINGDRLDVIEDVAERLSGVEIIDCIRSVEGAAKAIEGNANKALTLELMLYKLLKK